LVGASDIMAGSSFKGNHNEFIGEGAHELRVLIGLGVPTIPW